MVTFKRTDWPAVTANPLSNSFGESLGLDFDCVLARDQEIDQVVAVALGLYRRDNICCFIYSADCGCCNGAPPESVTVPEILPVLI